ncbi:hypothetical protein H0H92_011783 [Tricholoma furcatifolium]|nr:hypothetical protein H0H92_011783 [Tricholoma furcatifolium]
MPSINDSKSILVTGATSGIGRALALALAALPSQPKVVAAGRRQARLDELAKSNLHTIQFDLDTDAKGLKTFVDDVLQKHLDLDTIVLCAGIQHEVEFKEPVNVNNIISEINVNYTQLVESELHDAYGTTERLSKFWIPLDKYIEVTMEGLKNGDPSITTGTALDMFNRFDAGKLEPAEKLYKMHQSAAKANQYKVSMTFSSYHIAWPL